MDILKLIQHIQNTWYTEIVVFVLNVIAFKKVIARKEKQNLWFAIYFLTNSLALIIGWSLEALTQMSKVKKGYIYNDINTVIVIVELFAYTLFFESVLNNKRIKTSLKSILIVFLLLQGVFLFTKFSFITTRFRYVFSILSVLEFLILIPPCLAYYYELLNSKTAIRLNERPTFWIITGVFIFAVISTPFYLLNPLLWDLKASTRQILGIFLFQLPIIINLSFLIKGLSCKTELTI